MVEELKMLIPLLQGAGVGVFWLAVMLLAKGLLQTTMYCAVLVYTAKAIARFVTLKESQAYGKEKVLWMLAAAGYVDADGGFMYKQRERLSKLLGVRVT
jgi:hypothetical protein